MLERGILPLDDITVFRSDSLGSENEGRCQEYKNDVKEHGGRLESRDESELKESDNGQDPSWESKDSERRVLDGHELGLR